MEWYDHTTTTTTSQQQQPLGHSLFYSSNRVPTEKYNLIVDVSKQALDYLNPLQLQHRVKFHVKQRCYPLVFRNIKHIKGYNKKNSKKLTYNCNHAE
ncbi:unnamed protein product [Allacma fusca]|uniref:Uncharacterized protein n=1 Tax=Allacma fusca TaxID=39272 RepID=A0A8J2P732_9HEXA|nr:unnamed protein product [Allacma fusca]